MGTFFSFCFISSYGGGIDVVGYVYCSKLRQTHRDEQRLMEKQVRSFQPTYDLKAWHGPWSAHFYPLWYMSKPHQRPWPISNGDITSFSSF